MKSDKYGIYFINTIKSQKKFTTVYQIIVIMEENMIVIREPKTFYFNFDWPKHGDKSLKHEIEFITKSNQSLAQNKIKNNIEHLLSKYKHRNNIHEYVKQENK